MTFQWFRRLCEQHCHWRGDWIKDLQLFRSHTHYQSTLTMWVRALSWTDLETLLQRPRDGKLLLSSNCQRSSAFTAPVPGSEAKTSIRKNSTEFTKILSCLNTLHYDCSPVHFAFHTNSDSGQLPCNQVSRKIARSTLIHTGDFSVQTKYILLTRCCYRMPVISLLFPPEHKSVSRTSRTVPTVALPGPPTVGHWKHRANADETSNLCAHSHSFWTKQAVGSTSTHCLCGKEVVCSLHTYLKTHCALTLGHFSLHNRLEDNHNIKRKAFSWQKNPQK